MKKRFIYRLLVLLGVMLAYTVSVYAENWVEDFNMLCSKTEDADSLSPEQLEELIEQSDSLLDTIQKSEHKQKKIYIFRLKKCRNLFEYMLELSRQEETTPEDSD